MLELLRRVGLDPVLDFRLVRGLDYYTRTTFEFQSNAPRLRAEHDRRRRALRRPGRADRRAADAGLRVRQRARARHARGRPRGAPKTKGRSPTSCRFAHESRADAFALAQHLRRDLLIDAECDLAGRSAKAQLKQAGRSGAELALLVGLDDLADGEVRLRDLESGDEEDVAIDELGDWFDDWLADDDLDGHGRHHGNGNGNPLGGNGGGET